MTIRSRALPALAAMLAFAAAGCAMTPSASDFASTVSAAGRISSDYERDAARKPAEVLAFSRIGPGAETFSMRTPESGGNRTDEQRHTHSHTRVLIITACDSHGDAQDANV